MEMKNCEHVAKTAGGGKKKKKERFDGREF